MRRTRRAVGAAGDAFFAVRDSLVHWGVPIALALLVLAVWAEAYSGRQELVRAERAACRRLSVELAHDVNNLRADIANLRGDIGALGPAGYANWVAGHGGIQGLIALKRARMAESEADYASIRRKWDSILKKRVAIAEDDALVDRRDAYLLDSREDRRKARFSCRRAYPTASLVSLLL